MDGETVLSKGKLPSGANRTVEKLRVMCGSGVRVAPLFYYWRSNREGEKRQTFGVHPP